MIGYVYRVFAVGPAGKGGNPCVVIDSGQPLSEIEMHELASTAIAPGTAFLQQIPEGIYTRYFSPKY